MPRLFFNLFMGSHCNLDAEGHEVVSLPAAELEARRSASEMARDRLLNLQSVTPEDIRVEVKDEHRRLVLTVEVSIRVERAGLSPPCSM
jgi:hypothetical protein